MLTECYLKYFNGKDWFDDNRLHQYVCVYQLDHWDNIYRILDIKQIDRYGRINPYNNTMIDSYSHIYYIHAHDFDEALEILNTILYIINGRHIINEMNKLQSEMDNQYLLYPNKPMSLYYDEDNYPERWNKLADYLDKFCPELRDKSNCKLYPNCE
jgi:hypothetical protein